ncbi:putative alpha-1,2-mannosidase [Salegentibacter sp. 24]|uniref:GH92 family glycosyl hydrolase n=1 Tax=Salegentibacter sp. 24 TaxID=2183986 RepID=UPI001060DA98|nr:GH92 family glycosyl hydrolase [Salegentibacter sp. 24]TDN95056.1 putative alpha-1,2-mannosidase [Salegentibacter sp. 24]
MRKTIVACVFSVILFSCNNSKQDEPESSAKIKEKAYTSLVNPFIGTAPLTDPDFIGYTPPENWRVWAGLVFPGSSLPNAMVQLSPITEYGTGAGYQYEDTEILGFAHTNKGHWNLCNIPILPVSGNSKAPFKSTFSHEKEFASPGYYEVYLDDYDVRVRLTSTLRSGFHQYSFENNSGRKILFDLDKANNGVSQWEIKKNNDSVVSGFQRVGGDKVHFYAQTNVKIEELDVIGSGEKDGYAMLHLQDGEQPVNLKIGISYVSIENAAENLKLEIGKSGFEDIKKKADMKWENLLSTIEVTGGNEQQNELFYSSFYRSFLWPALRSDVNGEFKNVKGEVVKKDFEYYTNPSFWDTYRNKLVLLSIVSPEVTTDIIKSLINKGENTGFIPTFFHGDHAAPFIAGTYLRGNKDFNIEKAYQLLLNNAYKEGGPRPHIKEYIEKGYISDPDVENPGVETKAKAGVSKTLEYAYDDYSVAQLAKALGDNQKYEDLIDRSENYINVFDTSTNFMRGRLENGDWISPFNPEHPYYEYMYREANAWQVSFYAPHDMPELVELYGGKNEFEMKLDSLFSVPWNPDYIARNVASFIGQYSHGNQPDHEAAFSYYFVDKPEKSQKIIDNILENFYGVGEEGLALPGMDDAGEMSAWYVFAASGLYPLSPADPEYLVTVPIFEKVTWNLPGNKTLTIKRPNSGRKLKNIMVDQQDLEGYFIPHNLFETGGEVELVTE